MKKNWKILVALMLAAVLAVPLAACGGSSDSSSSDTSTDTAAEATTDDAAASDSDFDAAYFYCADGSFWRGSVETTGQTVYGTAGGTEPMEDVQFMEDGTCTITPNENHTDLLTDSTATWEGTESEVTITTTDGATITLTVVDDSTLEGTASDFGIADFDVITFVLY